MGDEETGRQPTADSRARKLAEEAAKFGGFRWGILHGGLGMRLRFRVRLLRLKVGDAGIETRSFWGVVARKFRAAAGVANA
jgi:hypothetical protein